MTECCICFEPLDSNKIIKLKCNHTFHYDCALKIKNNKCPLCRGFIINENICLGSHINYFYSSNFTKKGKCTICKKKSYKYYLKELIIN